MLAYFPRLRDELNVVHLTYDRPRPAIIDVLGEENQGAPALVLADPIRAESFKLAVKCSNTTSFLDDEKSILLYLSYAYGVSRSPR